MTTPTPAEAPLLHIEDLCVQFQADSGVARAVDGLDLVMQRGEVVGVVGESGCGKSVMARSIMRLVGTARGEQVTGRIDLDGEDLLAKSEEEMTHLRGRRVAMIFQDPMTALNPVLPVGDQVVEGLRWHQNLSRKAAFEQAVRLLDRVGIPSARQRARDYPHMFSGGMRQRVVIAMALSCGPDLLIADEPTTALDVTVQAQILSLLRALCDETGTGLLLITHDLGVVASLCDRVAVMYAGHLVEEASVAELFRNPRHPYTRGLLASLPGAERRERLQPIPGQPPDPTHVPDGCRFAPRCPHAYEACRTPPSWYRAGAQHRVRCWLEEGKAS